jgi:hypothetical protein
MTKEKNLININLASMQATAAKWVMAKGLGVTVLACYCIVTSLTIKTLYERINTIQSQMFELQNNVIRENTKAISEFNLTKNK